jgi:sugar phosphate isomerase/epimerase
MKLKLVKADWGMEYLGDMPERLRLYREAGYDGIECAHTGMSPDAFGDLTGELGLDYVAMMFCDDEQAFRQQLDAIKKTRPILINCHPGRDYFDLERGVAFFAAVMEMAKEVDCPVVYETHRTRALYSPWSTMRFLEALPELRICADFSHFTCVAEGTMEHGEAYTRMMDLAIERADHIHARVGSAQAPQVPDPRIPPYLEWTERFEGWWDRIIAARQTEGRPWLTINPEFGPFPYQPADPRTGAPHADTWETCLWMTQRFRDRWNA